MLCIRAGRLFDGERIGGTPTVLIENGSIVAVGAAPPADATVVDLGDGATLLPGLVDTHQHLCFNGIGTLEEQVCDIDDATLAVRARAAASRALQAGITTVRDLGDCRFVTLALREEPDLPTLLCAGPPITRVGGHCWYLGGEADGEPELREAVRERRRRGCDVVKVMATGGALTPTFPMWETQFTDEEMRAITEEARRAALPVAAHCHATAGIVQALDAGADTIEHCTFYGPTGSEPDDAVMQRLASSGTFVSATLGRLPDIAPPPNIAATIPIMREARRRMHELGARIVVGTDAGIGPAKPHDVLPHALAELQESGLTSVEALRAITSMAAAACGVADRKGSLRRGFDADVLAVSGNPLTDSTALLRPVGVWRGGVRAR